MKKLTLKTSNFPAGNKLFILQDKSYTVSTTAPTNTLGGVALPTEAGDYLIETSYGSFLLVMEKAPSKALVHEIISGEWLTFSINGDNETVLGSVATPAGLDFMHLESHPDGFLTKWTDYINNSVRLHDTSGALIWDYEITNSPGGGEIGGVLGVDSGKNTYISSSPDGVAEVYVQKISPTGQALWNVTHSVANISTPSTHDSCAQWYNGYVFVSARNQVLLLDDSDGTLLDSMTLTETNNPTSISTLAGDKFFVGYNLSLGGGGSYLHKFEIFSADNDALTRHNIVTASPDDGASYTANGITTDGANVWSFGRHTDTWITKVDETGLLYAKSYAGSGTTGTIAYADNVLIAGINYTISSVDLDTGDILETWKDYGGFSIPVVTFI